MAVIGTRIIFVTSELGIIPMGPVRYSSLCVLVCDLDTVNCVMRFIAAVAL